MNALELLFELEEEVAGQRGLFKKDGGRSAEIISRLKESLPLALEESEYIVSKQQQILKNADTAAKNTVRAAEERAQQLVCTTEIVKRAEEESRKILDKTAEKCDLLVKKTKEHLDAMFVEAEQFLLATLNMVRTNRQELQNAIIFRRTS